MPSASHVDVVCRLTWADETKLCFRWLPVLHLSFQIRSQVSVVVQALTCLECAGHFPTFQKRWWITLSWSFTKMAFKIERREALQLSSASSGEGHKCWGKNGIARALWKPCLCCAGLKLFSSAKFYVSTLHKVLLSAFLWSSALSVWESVAVLLVAYPYLLFVFWRLLLLTCPVLVLWISKTKTKEKLFLLKIS